LSKKTVSVIKQKSFYLCFDLILPLSVSVDDPQSLDDHDLLGLGVPAVTNVVRVSQERHQVVGSVLVVLLEIVVVAASLLSSAVRVDGLGLAGVVEDVALNGLALGHARGNEGTELEIRLKIRIKISIFRPFSKSTRRFMIT
jgi:hypothetical protein